MDEIDIPIGDRRDTGSGHNPHPWWSRLLYLGYGTFVGFGAAIAALSGETGAAFVAGGLAAVLVWKAAQRRR